MRLSLPSLRRLIKEAIGASENYMKKERIREDLQARIADAVSSGDVKNEKDLEDYFKTVDMAVKALKMIPFEVFVKLGKTKRK